MSIIDLIIDKVLLSRKLPYPRVISIEPVSNMCQLKCPLCPVGLQLLTQDRKIMSLETFKAILNKMPFIRTIDLYRSGEPFLNPDIFDIIRYASDRNIKVIISTHFSFPKSEEFFEDIVTSGLSRLVISLDGASQESYSHYRIGGNFDLVMSNIKKLLGVKNRLNSNKPEIIWQFLVNKFNEHEIAEAQKLSRDLKIKLDLRPLDLDDELPDVELDETIGDRMAHWLPVNKKYIADRYQGKFHYPLFSGLCKDLFIRPVVTVDGKVMPCCLTWDTSNFFGDLLTESLEDIWYNRKYLDARSRFLKIDVRPQDQSICYRCNNFGSKPTFRDKFNLLLVVYKKYIGIWLKSF
jgi:MoaA/NifB/PqqE/SkfB family radical SAM enzyme